jgi:hypothetical protein
MKTVQPQTGAAEITVAVSQEEYEPIITAMYLETELRSLVYVSRWKPSDKEREAIARGEDIYLAVLTFGRQLQPTMIQIGNGGLVADSLYGNYRMVKPEDL